MAGRAAALLLTVCLLRSAGAASFQPGDNFLINCGGNGTVDFGDGRAFRPDSGAPSLAVSSSSQAVAGSGAGLYGSARVFAAPATYRFGISRRGRHFVRLHLYPVRGAGYDLRSAVFSVTAGGFTLLSDFSFAKLGSYSALMKEYLIGADSDAVVLILVPADGSVAFVNGIEVISVPDHLLPSAAAPVPVGAPSEIPFDMAIETFYRINVGGPFVNSENDTLWRVWEIDRPFLVNAAAVRSVSTELDMVKYPPGVSIETAPRWIYATAQEMADANVGNQKFNISWVFPVDPSFSYWVRLHFCDIVSKALGHLVFNVYINSQSALRDFDISSKTMELSAAFFMDFAVEGGIDSEKILVQIGPSELANIQPNAILNGLEIMKLSNADKSLGASRAPYPPGEESSKKKLMAVVLVGSALGASALLGLAVAVLILCSRRRRRRRRRRRHEVKTPQQPSHTAAWLAVPSLGGHSETKASANTFASSGSLALGRFLAFSEIREATKNFDESSVLGMGGFGKVYRGVLENGDVVAVKRGNPRSQQGLVEFRTEIEMLSKLRHRHLVSLIGYCQEPDEMVLVYEYMAGGSLRKHLYGSGMPALSWTQRLEICIGAAKGLHYLHTGASETIIHRDVKTTNILLDEKLVAKVADFGLSRIGPSLNDTHVSTAVKGSFGYLDPEYFRRQQLTEKSDVYSFGVVLMEVLCARPAINPSLPREQVNIAEWAMEWQKKGQLKQIVDPHLAGSLSVDSLRVYGETAEKCLAEHGIERPTMGEVLWSLEYALQLQLSFQGAEAPGEENGARGIQDPPERIQSKGSAEIDHPRPLAGGGGGGGDGSEVTSTSAAFSQIMNPKGR